MDRRRFTALVAVGILASSWRVSPQTPPKIVFDHTHTFAEAAAYLTAVSKAYPDITRLHTIGKSFLGKDLLVLEIFKANTLKMHRAGVKIAVGTDAGGTVGYNFQGYNTPREIEILVESGLTPMEALVAATRTGAEVIGVQDTLGTVEAGKLADLLILSADPLADIRNVRRIETVVQNGVVFPRDAFAYTAAR